MVLEAGLALLLLGFLVTGVGELVFLKAAHAWQLYAHPNSRSSHQQPTPSMGGIAMAVPIIALVAYMAAVGFGDLFGLAAGGLLVAAISLWDDLRELSPRVRLPVHVLAVALALSSVGPLPASWTFSLLLLAGVAVTWHVNLFNFMDGIDGYAGSQTLLFALAVLLLDQGGSGWTGAVLHLLVGSSLGFLIYNWPPARLFMGDVGSSFLGLLIGVLVVQLAVSGQQPLIGSLLILVGFWFDASYTLGIRILTRQQFTEAHRSHLYQRLTDHWGHAKTTGLFWLHGLLWLVPLAWLSNRHPQFALGCLVLGVLPITWACWRFRAGQLQGPKLSEQRQQNL